MGTVCELAGRTQSHEIQTSIQTSWFLWVQQASIQEYRSFEGQLSNVQQRE